MDINTNIFINKITFANIESFINESFQVVELFIFFVLV